MNRGLWLKAWRESWLMTLLLGLGLLIAASVITFAMWRFQASMTAALRKLAFFHDWIRSMLGVRVAEEIGPDALRAMAWVHPVVLALIWTHAIAHCTRLPAGEVDRGTIDVLMAMPVTRWQLYLAETIVWLVLGVLLVSMGALGFVVGNRVLTTGPWVDLSIVLIATVNLFCLYAAVGGLAWFVSSLSNRRGKAVGAVFAFVLVSFLLNFVAQFWEAAEYLSFVSLLHYYRPAGILHNGAWPANDMMVLAGMALALWVAGGFIFARRDLATL